MRVWLAGFAAILGVAGCATSADPPSTPSSSAFGTGMPGGSTSGAGQSSGGDSPSTSGGSSGGGSGSSGGSGSAGSDDAGSASDDATTGDDASPGVPGSDDASPPPLFPPLTLPDSGSSSGDANACSTKICIDPVFDCPLQGCFNGCVNFVCQ